MVFYILKHGENWVKLCIEIYLSDTLIQQKKEEKSPNFNKVI